jgi:hypothetical protein
MFDFTDVAIVVCVAALLGYFGFLGSQSRNSKSAKTAQTVRPKRQVFKHVLTVSDLPKADRLMEQLKEKGVQSSLAMDSDQKPTITFTIPEQLKNVDEFKKKNFLLKAEITSMLVDDPEGEDVPRMIFS